MATAFTAEERQRIQSALLHTALRYASTVGARRVTVTELAREAGISKGAFYGFYQSKEHLFLDMVERIHQEMYGNARRVLAENGDKSIGQRVYLAIAEVHRVALERNVLGFIREEVPLILRRLPPETAKELYHSDTESIRELIRVANVRLTTDAETACAVVRVLLMTVLYKDDVGDRYQEAMEKIIAGSCRQLIREPG